MKRWLQHTLVAAVALVALGGAGLTLGVWMGDGKAQRQVQVTASAVAIPSDAASQERGLCQLAGRICT